MAGHHHDRELERAAILRRRAQLVACAMVAGVGLPQCSTCLSPADNTGGAPVGPIGSSGAPTGAGAAAGENGGEGGQAFCLTIAEPGGAPAGGAPSAAGGEGGGGPTLCLSVK
ncbi:MAG TPA: hypothetical protein VEX18_14140 [Polyangiaceae bacterium]|nr:hypothetical protein [Polyangiaceae bacterium]